MTLGPLLFLVAPGVLSESHETAAEALAAEAERSAAAGHFLLLLQVAGAIVFLLAVPALLVGLAGRRAGLLRVAGVGAVLLGALAALPLLGMELAQTRLLHLDEETAAMVDLALRVQEGAAFGVLLVLALTGLFLGVLLLAVSLWRAGVIPPWPLLLFLAPVAVAFLPLPGRTNEIAALLALLVPLAWISRALWALRRRPLPD